MSESSANRTLHPSHFLRACLITAAVLLSVVPAFALDAASAGTLADTVLARLGRTKGVALIPNCGNGRLALSILQKSGMKVHATDPDAADVAAAVGLCTGAGYYMPQFYSDKGTTSVMPYADRFVDAIVITNLADADLANVSYAEIQRALAPGGMAWVGRATSEGAGITQAALQSWTNAAAKTRSTAAISTSGGTWAVITGRELSGIDVWTHHNYDASGVKYSKDSVAAFPWLPQAKIKPYRKQGDATAVTSGGRMYYISQDRTANGANPVVLRTYSIYNGELLWSRDATADNVGSLNTNPVIAYDQDVYLNKNGTWLRINGATGAEIGTVASVPTRPSNPAPMPTNGELHGCGPRSASINATYASTAMYGWDFLDNVQRAGHFYKAPCGKIGTLQSNGFHINVAPTCGCGSSRMQGTHLDGTDRTFTFDRDAPADGAGRLEQGPAFSDLSALVNPDSLDWPTHRSTVSHSGRSLAAVPASATAPGLLWNWAPPHSYVTARTSLAYDYLPEQEPTPPAVAGRYTFIGGSDGFVRCIDNATGLLKWSYATGGRIFATPTVSSGCVYVGSADGSAYCIEAHSGRLVWRYRGAPVDRRFNLYGSLSSMWPVLSGVLVSGGNAFFVAGLQSEYGSHLYCVNARTGALVWQNNKGATWMNTLDRLGYTPCGYLTVAKNRLIAANSVAGPASFNIATGTQDPLPTYGNMGLARNGYPAICVSRGKEVGVINDTWLVRGARIMFSDHNSRYFISWWPTPNFVGFNQLDANGAVTYPSAALNSVTFTAPAWSADAYYQCTYSGTLGLRQFSMAAFTTVLARERAMDSMPGWGIARGAPFQGSVDANTPQSWWPASDWARNDINVSAIAAAPNGVVALYCKSASSGNIPVPEAVDWYVGVLSKTNGTTVWESRLPNVGTNLTGEPLFEGVAVDRTGNIIVVQRNGNVLCYGNTPVSVARDSRAPRLRSGTGTVTGSAAPVGNDPADLTMQPVTPAPENEKRADMKGGRLLNPTITRPEGGSGEAYYEQAAAADKSDLVAVGEGAFRHSLPPDVRVQQLKNAGNAADMVWKTAVQCLPVAAVTSSSSSGKVNAAGKTVDRDLRTRWSPAREGEQWLTYDLGTVRTVSSASIVWFNRHTQEIPFSVQVSTDGKSYQTVDNGVLDGQGRGESQRTFLAQEARYVRIAFTLKPGEGPRTVVQEVGIHGEAQQALR